MKFFIYCGLILFSVFILVGCADSGSPTAELTAELTPLIEQIELPPRIEIATPIE